jgi:hypothetical protein
LGRSCRSDWSSMPNTPPSSRGHLEISNGEQWYEPPLAPYAFHVWFTGLLLPFVVLTVECLLDEVGGLHRPVGELELYAVCATFVVGAVLTTTGCFMSKYRLLDRIALSILSLFLFPVGFFLLVVALILTFGFTAP